MSNRKPLSKSEKSLFWVCAVAILPLAAVVFVAGRRDAEPAWDIPPAAKRPTPNGYDFYLAAAAATVRFTPEVDPASDTHYSLGVDLATSPYALKNYSLARRKQWLAANAKTFALVNQGLHKPSMSPDFAGKPNPNRANLRQLARDIGVRTNTLKMEGQPIAATQSALDGMQMAQDTARGGGLVARVIGVSITSISRRPLDDFDHTINQLNSAEARTAAQRLEAILAREPKQLQVFIEDNRYNLLELRRLFTFPGWRGAWEQQMHGYGVESEFDVLQRQTIFKATICDNMNRAYKTWIAVSRLPYSKAQAAPVPPNLDPFSKDLLGLPHRYLEIEARHHTSNNMLLLRLALRAYIAEHGAAPPTLAALVPGILKAIPTDVYNDGKPLFYVPKGTTYQLWSVGPDGKNDGGVPLSRRPGASTTEPAPNLLDNTGDFVAGLCR